MHTGNAGEHGDEHGDDPVLQRLAALEAMVTGQQERLAQQQEEIERLRAALDTTERQPDLILPATSRRGERRPLSQTSRRALLKAGGVAAAVGVAAATADMVARPQHARAASATWQTQATIAADGQTIVKPSSSGYSDPDILQIQLGTGPVSPAPLNAGIAAYDTTGVSIGVYGGSAAGYGLFGATDTGNGATGAGLKGNAASSGTGVLGMSGNGIGVQGASSTGIGGSFSGGQAPLALGLAGAGGPPTSGTHAAGEIYADSAAVLWLCKQGGSPGSWAQVGTGQPNYLNGVVNLLPVAMRLLDTRAGAPAGSANLLTGTPIPRYGTLQIPTGGVTFAGQTIPAGARAVIGYLIAAVPNGADPGAGSSMIAWPNGQSRPNAVNIVYNPPGYTGSLAVVPIGTSGLVNLYSQPIYNAAVDAIFDAFGFVM